jgi:biotin synthase
VPRTFATTPGRSPQHLDVRHHRWTFATTATILLSAAPHNVELMPALITRDEALRLGEIEDHEQIESLVERAWQARVERFGDSTDMCSLVNAKSGGCAEDCGFCAQSRFADAETPMHALMDPEQVLEHARAAEAAGAHRFCMVTQGQGLSKRDFEKYLQGVRLVAEHTNLKRCASIGHMSAGRAEALKQAGIQRVHHNVETASSYYDEVSTTVRYEGRLRTIQAVREAGLETCVGGILNLGETREQRVEMAFELAAIDPTSVPINLLNPRPGTKFGDRELIDPWEAVKWIAIFRLILPEALFRLCGGRVENLGELQPLAIKAGLNGVMMGNFLTTLGAAPEQDRTMFEEHGLNVARQPDNAANPRPDNRSGWLSGATPDVVEELLDSPAQTSADARAAESRNGGRPELEIRLWDPSTQLRYRAKRSVPPRPDGLGERTSSHRRRSDREADPRPSETAPSPVPAGWGD